MGTAILKKFITIFIVYFVVIEPVRNAPIFQAITSHLLRHQKIQTAIEGSIVATATMLFFALCGAWILHYPAISFSAFKIVGALFCF